MISPKKVVQCLAIWLVLLHGRAAAAGVVKVAEVVPVHLPDHVVEVEALPGSGESQLVFVTAEGLIGRLDWTTREVKWKSLPPMGHKCVGVCPLQDGEVLWVMAQGKTPEARQPAGEGQSATKSKTDTDAWPDRPDDQTPVRQHTQREELVDLTRVFGPVPLPLEKSQEEPQPLYFAILESEGGKALLTFEGPEVPGRSWCVREFDRHETVLLCGLHPGNLHFRRAELHHNVLAVDTQHGTVQWQVEVVGDIIWGAHRLGEKRLLLTHGLGWTAWDVDTGKMLRHGMGLVLYGATPLDGETLIGVYVSPEGPAWIAKQPLGDYAPLQDRHEELLHKLPMSTNELPRLALSPGRRFVALHLFKEGDVVGEIFRGGPFYIYVYDLATSREVGMLSFETPPQFITWLSDTRFAAVLYPVYDLARFREVGIPSFETSAEFMEWISDNRSAALVHPGKIVVCELEGTSGQ